MSSTSKLFLPALLAVAFVFLNSREQILTFLKTKEEAESFKATLDKKNAYEFTYEENFFTEKALKSVMDIIEQNKISIILEDAGVEGIGEEVPIGHPDCDRNYMGISKNGTLCVLPHRIDVAMNYFKIGGFLGIMESYEKMASRLFSFRHKLLDYFDRKKLEEIYGTKFLDRAKDLCMKNTIVEYDEDKLITDLFQFDVIVVLPGQELPMHLDIPYFWSADRKSLPHWLLALMKQSQLFNDRFIPQVQGVAWLSKHQHEKSEEEAAYNSGNFYLYPLKDKRHNYVIANAKYNGAILVDGTQVVHGVERYKPRETPPHFERDSKYFLAHNKKTNGWDLMDTNDKKMRSYDAGDIRMSLVWRVQCFADEEERIKYKNQTERLGLKEILDVFKKDLTEKKGYSLKNLNSMRAIDFYKLLVDTYNLYPNNKYNTVYNNYCFLTNYTPDYLNKFIQPLLNLVC